MHSHEDRARRWLDALRHRPSEQLTSLAALLAEVERETRNECGRAVEAHFATCSDRDDIVCAGQNCEMLILSAIRMKESTDAR